MLFDIHKPLFQDDDYPEEEIEAYIAALTAGFDASPEAAALDADDARIGLIDATVRYGASYQGVTPATMTAADLDEILFSIFPRKVSCPPEDAVAIITEQRAFWRFLKREYQLPEAERCLQLLGDEAVARLEREMGDPANFGMAKGLFMMGESMGFDVTSEEGLNEWMHTYNAMNALAREEPELISRVVEALEAESRSRLPASKKKRKQRRKRQKASRRKNRRR